jgi:hypothetical protein
MRKIMTNEQSRRMLLEMIESGEIDPNDLKIRQRNFADACEAAKIALKEIDKRNKYDNAR